MDFLSYTFKKLLLSACLLLGVTFISFLLMVYFGPDLTYSLLGKSPSAADIANIHMQLGYDRPIFIRYLMFLQEVLTLNFGFSDATHESVTSLIARTLPVSLKVNAPGFVIGQILAVIIGLYAAYHRGGWRDKAVMFCSGIGMSVSFLIVIILFQYIFCSSYGLNLFPVQGWDSHHYLRSATVPTLAIVFVSFGYSTRFFRAVLVEEMNHEHVRTAIAYGCGPIELLYKHVLRNALVPMIARTIFSIPFVVIEGSLLVESFFGIPGIGQVTYTAITQGDLPVLKAVVTLGAFLYVGILFLTDILYKAVDPRVALS